MKKSLFLFATVLLMSTSLFAQDIYLSWEGEVLGDTVTVWGEPTANEFVFNANVHNTSDQWKRIKVRRNQLEIVDSTTNLFCWGSCNGIDVDESQDSILIPSGGLSVDTAFSGHYFPNAKIGTSVVEYMFYNQYDEDEYVKVLVMYWASPESITDDVMEGGLVSDIYPNPTSRTVSINYELPATVHSAQLRIFNIYGAVVVDNVIDCQANKLTLDVSELESGIYFYSILLNGSLYQTKKLIVR